MTGQVIIWALVLVLFGTNTGNQHFNNGSSTMKRKCHSKMPVRLGPDWDFSFWFTVLGPITGVLLGILGVLLLDH